MLTGTPLDLTPFGGLLAALGWLYWLVALAIVLVALWWPKRFWVKLASASVVLGAVVYPVFIRPAVTHVDTARAQQAEFKARLDAAMALFNERCKTAGEKITRTVENVDGVVWMRWREAGVNLGDQFKLDDPYGKDCSEETCIANLLRVTKGANLNPEETQLHSKGYRFIEAVDPRDGQRYRYTGHLEHGWTLEQVEAHKKTGREIPAFSYHFKLDRARIDAFTARYGITWEDISTREDREHWIAGSSLMAIDLQANETIASRTAYLIDTGQGDTGGFRSPWGWAKSYAPRCPRTNMSAPEFATSVIQPTKQGE